jgi:phosphate acetyltransferase
MQNGTQGNNVGRQALFPTVQCWQDGGRRFYRGSPMKANAGENYRRLIASVTALPATPTAVAHPCDESSLAGAIDAAKLGIIAPILVGPRAKILAAATAAKLDVTPYEIVDAEHSHAAAEQAVALVRQGRAAMLMKGSLGTAELLGAVVKRDTGLRTARRLSHCFIMDVPDHPNVLVVTDAAINVFPTLEDKIDIVQNAIDFAHALGIGTPKVAILSAMETVNPKLPSTVEAAALCKMADRGQITGGLLDGPLALDNAISPEAARIKNISGPVAGHADILVVPDLEAGNVLAKSLSFLTGADSAGIVLGTRAPITLTSRADTVQSRLASCAVAALVAHRRQEAAAKAA